MTSFDDHASSAVPKVGGSRSRQLKSSAWRLQDAKTHFSELVPRVRTDGPQSVTVHGRNEVVVISAQEFRRLKGEQSGLALVEAMQASPYRDVGLEPAGTKMPIRTVEL